MRLDAARAMAVDGRLYPSLIVHGGSRDDRIAAAEDLGKRVLCSAAPESRPCGECRHCRRIAVDDDEAFHPDVAVLRRDLKTGTSVEATKAFLRLAQQTPFEARGQVFVVVEAETLTGGAANALLKVLEEPPVRAPRHFFLLAPAQDDLLPTLRSRSWAVFLGGATRLDPEEVGALGDRFAAAVDRWSGSGSGIELLIAAGILDEAGGWEDLRAEAPWTLAAASVVEAFRSQANPDIRRRLLALAEDLLDGSRWRVRNVPARRILEGLVSRHLDR